MDLRFNHLTERFFLVNILGGSRVIVVLKKGQGNHKPEENDLRWKQGQREGI